MATRVFVYGTLRRGEYNHHYLSSATYVGQTRTEPSFTLVDLGGYPGLLLEGSTPVVGELYDVDVTTLARLDLLEEAPEVYRRQWLHLNAEVSAMVYVIPKRFTHQAPVLVSGDWCDK